jgi:hypothetical protein
MATKIHDLLSEVKLFSKKETSQVIDKEATYKALYTGEQGATPIINPPTADFEDKQRPYLPNHFKQFYELDEIRHIVSKGNTFDYLSLLNDVGEEIMQKARVEPLHNYFSGRAYNIHQEGKRSYHELLLRQPGTEYNSNIIKVFEPKEGVTPHVLSLSTEVVFGLFDEIFDTSDLPENQISYQGQGHNNYVSEITKENPLQMSVGLHKKRESHRLFLMSPEAFEAYSKIRID